jgi:hypothetical protein
VNSSTEGITIGGGGFLLSNEYLLEHTIPVTLVVGETYYLSQYMFTEALAVGSSIRDPETGQIIGHRSATVGVDFFNTGSFNFVDPSGQVTFNQTNRPQHPRALIVPAVFDQPRLSGEEKATVSRSLNFSR